MSTQLVVANIDLSIEFYTKKLGFDIDFKYEDFYVGIIKDNFSIHLKLGNPSIEIRKNKRDQLHLDLLFVVDNLEELYNYFLNENVEIVMPLRMVPYC